MFQINIGTIHNLYFPLKNNTALDEIIFSLQSIVKKSPAKRTYLERD